MKFQFTTYQRENMFIVFDRMTANPVAFLFEGNAGQELRITRKLNTGVTAYL